MKSTVNKATGPTKRPLEVPVVSIPNSKKQATTQKRLKPSHTGTTVIKETTAAGSSATSTTTSTPSSITKTINTNESNAVASKKRSQPPSSSSSAVELPPQPMPNIYDAMLGEIQDLVSAAHEAQACGRLKMASTYQLLVHARLVGLGKRFDRFLTSDQIIRKKEVQPMNCNDNNTSQQNIPNNNLSSSLAPPPPTTTTTTTTVAAPSVSSVLKNENTAGNINSSTAINEVTKSSPGDSIRTAQAALAKILPSEVNLDYTMMEHLARAAMELHNRRTGRGMLHEKEMEKKYNAAANSMSMATTPIKRNGAGASSSGVAWTSKEKEECLRAAEMYGKEKVELIAKSVGSRTESEVKAHLKNIDGMKRVERDVKDSNTSGITSDSPANVKKNGITGKEDVSVTGESTPEKRKGRGKKEPPRAVLTVPNTTFDAKKMVFEPI